MCDILLAVIDLKTFYDEKQNDFTFSLPFRKVSYSGSKNVCEFHRVGCIKIKYEIQF